MTEFDQLPFNFFFFSEEACLLQTLSLGPFPDVHVNIDVSGSAGIFYDF